MPKTQLNSLSDIQLMANLVNTNSEINAELAKVHRAYLGLELVRRIESIGFTNDFLNRDVLFFSAGMDKLEVVDWITNNFEVYYDSLLTLVSFTEFSSLDPEDEVMPVLDSRKSLVIEYDFADEDMTGIKSGTFPRDPFHDDAEIPYGFGVIATNELGDIFNISGSIPIDMLEVEHIVSQ